MFIEEMQILVDCKRLVETILEEKKYIIERLHKDGIGEYDKYLQQEINRLEAALQGKGVRPHEHP